jgi:hypothetical protein
VVVVEATEIEMTVKTVAVEGVHPEGTLTIVSRTEDTKVDVLEGWMTRVLNVTFERWE